MSLLDFKNKWTIQTSERFVPRDTQSPEKRFTSIESPGFQKWTNTNMYRTSYNDMSNKVSRRKNKASSLTLVCAYKFSNDILICRVLQLARRTSTSQATKGTSQLTSPKTTSSL